MTLSEWPRKVWMAARVRMSQTRTVRSRPPLTTMSSFGWSARQWTALLCPKKSRIISLRYKSQHLMAWSSLALNMYGDSVLSATVRTASLCPVRFIFNAPEVRSHTLMRPSPAPVANQLLVGSTATVHTQPWCPTKTLANFHLGGAT